MSVTEGDDSYLKGIRVLEVADELGEYAGKVLAGLGADVVKVEPPGGEVTRTYGPFYQDEPGADRSLHFWHYNHGKRGTVIDLDSEDGRREFRALASVADVIIDARSSGYLAERGLGFDELKTENPGLIYARVTPFGEQGPWSEFVASDLVHLALGGSMMNSGYDPDPQMRYDTPPIAPQMWHAYHVAGEYTVISLLAALRYRLHTGAGQYLSTSVHQANASSTEGDHPMWLALRTPYLRQTGRHASAALTRRMIAQTKDGRYVVPYTTYVKNFPSSWEVDIAILRKHGMQADLDEPQWEDPSYRADHQVHLADVMDKLVARTLFDSGLWQEMLAAGLTWAPVRRPEENLEDEHWSQRHTFSTVRHPELGKSFTYVGARWVSNQASWSLSRRAPLLGEHGDEIADEWGSARVKHSVKYRRAGSDSPRVLSPHGKPFALSGVRVVDLGWMLASAGAGRFLAGMGAEVIKVEHMSRLDGMRYAHMLYPPGGREEREAATQPIPVPKQTSVNQSANFNEINAGKLGLSLNLKDERGRKVLEDLIRNADVFVEGYAPGAMERMGFGYERLKELNPRIVYVQQSGLGQQGTYGGAKAFGPTAQAFSGLTDMAGLPAPWPPAGIGYSYLDWFGAYNAATAVLAALYRRDTTGEGCYIDASQVEVGIYLAGTAILDYTVNGRRWSRYGNQSPNKLAAPHGAYPAAGEDRWVAIANFTQSHWLSTIDVLGNPAWASDSRFASLESRVAHQEELDRLLGTETIKWDRYELMDALQVRGVPAGVTQDAQDRVEHDPQLAALEWLTELNQTDYGVWPVKAHAVQFSETPVYAGGFKDRNGPNYGEDTEEILSRVLGYSPDQIDVLRREQVV